MSYFDPQQIGQDIKPNAVDNTADIHWTVVEKDLRRFRFRQVMVVTLSSEP